MKNTNKYKYIISGYYTAGGERKHFWYEIEAESNTQAMEIIIGKPAWAASLENKTFILDNIHYEVLNH